MGRRSDPASDGVLLGGLLGAASASASLVGGAGAMQLLFPVLCVGAGGWLLLRGRWHAYMAFTILLWLVAPEMRRFVDWQSSYHAFSLITMAPAMVSLIALPWAVVARRRLHRDVCGGGGHACLPVTDVRCAARRHARAARQGRVERAQASVPSTPVLAWIALRRW